MSVCLYICMYVCPLGVTFYWSGMETSSQKGSSLNCPNKNWQKTLSGHPRKERQLKKDKTGFYLINYIKVVFPQPWSAPGLGSSPHQGLQGTTDRTPQVAAGGRSWREKKNSYPTSNCLHLSRTLSESLSPLRSRYLSEEVRKQEMFTDRREVQWIILILTLETKTGNYTTSSELGNKY